MTACVVQDTGKTQIETQPTSTYHQSWRNTRSHLNDETETSSNLVGTLQLKLDTRQPIKLVRAQETNQTSAFVDPSGLEMFVTIRSHVHVATASCDVVSRCVVSCLLSSPDLGDGLQLRMMNTKLRHLDSRCVEQCCGGDSNGKRTGILWQLQRPMIAIAPLVHSMFMPRYLVWAPEAYAGGHDAEPSKQRN